MDNAGLADSSATVGMTWGGICDGSFFFLDQACGGFCGFYGVV